MFDSDLRLLKKCLDAKLGIDSESSSVQLNRYCDNLGKILIKKSPKSNQVKNICDEFYTNLGYAHVVFDGIIYYSRREDELMVEVIPSNGQIQIEVTRNHYFEVSL